MRFQTVVDQLKLISNTFDFERSLALSHLFSLTSSNIMMAGRGSADVKELPVKLSFQRATPMTALAKY